MNERIKELILEAGFPKFDEMYVVSDGKELERFAKLIVKECIDICYEIDKDYAGEDVLATWCADEIRKRFSEKPHFFAKEISEQSESQEPVGAVEYSELEQMKDECDSYRDMMDAFSADNDLLYAILRHAETEMRYAGWDVRQEDNFMRHQLYQRIQEVLKGEEMSDAESQEPIGSVESNDLQGFISDDYSHILVYPKGSYPEGGVDLYTAPPPAFQEIEELNELYMAAKNVIDWTEAAHRPPVCDAFETGRMVLVRLHALADLQDAIESIKGKNQ